MRIKPFVAKPVKSYCKPAPMLPQFGASPQYTGYRIGLLRKVYEVLARCGNIPNQESFISDCLNDREIMSLMDNSVVNKLDEVGGVPKLLLTVYSKYIQHLV